MNESTVEIDVDGLPVEVDAKEYALNPEAVVEAVRSARAEVVGDLTGIHEEFPDYDTLEAVAAHEAGL